VFFRRKWKVFKGNSDFYRISVICQLSFTLTAQNTKKAEVEGTAAIAKIDFFRGKKRTCVDFLSLYKYGEEWRLVCWTTYHYPDSTIGFGTSVSQMGILRSYINE